MTHVKYDTYRLWVIDNPETIQAMQKTISAIERVSLMEISHAANNMLASIVTLADNPQDLPPRTRMELHAYLKELGGEIEEKHGAGTREDIKAKDFLLTGPKTRHAEKKATVNIKPLDDGSVDVTVIKEEDIIDVSTEESDPLPLPVQSGSQ